MSGGGGIGKAIGSIGGGVGNVVGSAVGSLGGAGNVIGPAIQLASGANPLGVFGASLASQVAGDMMSGGGGGSGNTGVTPGQTNMQTVYAKPDYNYGANTYTLKNKPLDASKYFITGEKGVYNLMPMLGDLYGNKATDRLPGTSSFNTYQSIYDKMAGDTKAQEALAAAYGPKSFTPTYDPTAFRPQPVAGWGMAPRPLTPQQRMEQMARNQIYKQANQPGYVDKDLMRAIQEQRKSVKIDPFKYDKNRRDFKNTREFLAARQAAKDAYYKNAFESNYKPVQYVDWGFGSGANTLKNPWEALSNYAGKQNNPFFVPFAPAPETPAVAPETPVEPTPMASGGLAALARRR